MWEIKIFLVSVWLEEKEEKKIDEIQIFSTQAHQNYFSPKCGKSTKRKRLTKMS